MTKMARFLKICLVVLGILFIWDLILYEDFDLGWYWLTSYDTFAALVSFTLAWIVGRVDALTGGGKPPEQDVPQE